MRLLILVTGIPRQTDIKAAFRLLPIDPESLNLLGFFIKDYFYFDKCRPMGCCLSCCYFEAFASFLEWVVSQVVGVQSLIHYLDNFLFLGPPKTKVCMDLLSSFFSICKAFGVPLAQEKTVFPSTCLEFLGITIDMVLMEFRLPMEFFLE